MIENPYEAPLAAEPLQTRTQHRAFKFLGPIEYLILVGYAGLLAGAVFARLISNMPWVSADRLQSSLTFGLAAALTLITSTGLRGLYFVLRRNQKLAVVNGLLCVLGFFVIVTAGLLVGEL